MLACRLFKTFSFAQDDRFIVRLPPLVGCSILITSALNHCQISTPWSCQPRLVFIQGCPFHTQDLLGFVYNKAIGLSDEYDLGTCAPQLTPASTLVMSSTLMPANGRFDASPLAASVASVRTWLGLPRLNLRLRNDVWKAHLELLKTRLAILTLVEEKSRHVFGDGMLPIIFPNPS